MAAEHPIVLVDSAWPDPRTHSAIAEVAQRERWQVVFLDHRGGRFIATTFQRFDGVLGHYKPTSTKELGQVEAWGCPLVNLSTYPLPELTVPTACVTHDGRAIGIAGARHLITEGHRHLAWLNRSSSVVERLRRDGFIAEAERHGLSVTLLPSGHRDGEALAARLRELPKPQAVMCESDDYAIAFLEVVRRNGFAVPEDVAVLGVDDDPLLCLHSRPQLASVRADLGMVARRGAETLADLMAGRAVASVTLIPPIGIAERESARFVMVDHDAVLAALAFIARHATGGITAEDVVAAGELSRSALYRAFAKHRHRSVAEEITAHRLEAATAMLTATRRSQADIAAACGFGSAEVFLRAFKRRYGQTPGRWRLHAHRH